MKNKGPNSPIEKQEIEKQNAQWKKKIDNVSEKTDDEYNKNHDL